MVQLCWNPSIQIILHYSVVVLLNFQLSQGSAATYLMAGFIPVFSAVHHWLQQWKNYWNRSVFAEIIHQRITAYFFDPPCRSPWSNWQGPVTSITGIKIYRQTWNPLPKHKNPPHKITILADHQWSRIRRSAKHHTSRISWTSAQYTPRICAVWIPPPSPAKNDCRPLHQGVRFFTGTALRTRPAT